MPITSSSIFSSDAAASAPERDWGLFAAWLVGAAAVAFLVLSALCVVLDPYGTGRFALLTAQGTPERGPRAANASRARDPAVSGAIIGNSHIQLVSPAVLRAATGAPSASLIVPGTGPGEQFITLDYFLRHRARPVDALVIGIDGTWCTVDPALPFANPFPDWLYDARPWRYLTGLVRYDTLKRLPRRVAFALGRERPVAPDGYWNYDAEQVWRADIVLPILARRIAAGPANLSGRFPAAEALAARLDGALLDVPVVLVRPPVYASALPEPGSVQARANEACRSAFQALTVGRRHVRMLDWQVDRPEARMPENFFDHGHYRSAVARAIEADIAAALAGLVNSR